MTHVLFSCYRKDEAHDPDIYCAAVAATLADFPRDVVEYVTDPRTGIPSESKFLPNVAEVRAFCVREAERRRKLVQPRRPSVEFVPPPLKRGEIGSKMHAELVAAGKTKPRPIGRFEKADDEWNR